MPLFSKKENKNLKLKTRIKRHKKSATKKAGKKPSRLFIKLF